MIAFLLSLALLVFQPAPVTIAECLLADGYSRGVPDTPITTLAGVEAWGGGLGERVLSEGAQIGMAFVADSDERTRMVEFYAYNGSVFVFVYMHPDNPLRRLPGEPAGVWHGSCLLRIKGE